MTKLMKWISDFWFAGDEKLKKEIIDHVNAELKRMGMEWSADTRKRQAEFDTRANNMAENFQRMTTMMSESHDKEKKNEDRADAMLEAVKGQATALKEISELLKTKIHS